MNVSSLLVARLVVKAATCGGRSISQLNDPAPGNLRKARNRPLAKGKTDIFKLYIGKRLTVASLQLGLPTISAVEHHSAFSDDHDAAW